LSQNKIKRARIEVMPVILATQEEEIGRITFQDHPEQKVNENHPPSPSTSWAW
jgi:hypothetical protein